MKYKPFHWSWSKKEEKKANMPVFNTRKEAWNYIYDMPCKIFPNQKIENCDSCQCEWGVEEII